MTTARVVGAGLSGLVAAWRLVEAGFLVDVIEAADQPGGLIETTATSHGRVERAANAFVWTPAVAMLFRSFDVAPEFASAESRRRYIFRDGRPRRWPLGPEETLTMAIRAAGSTVTRRSMPIGRETAAAWGNRVWGPGATRWLLSPALQGLYAAPAGELAAAAIFGRTASTPFRRARSTVATPAGGMSQLMNRMVDVLARRGATFSFGTRIDALDPSTPTVVATSADAAGHLVGPHAPGLGAALAMLPMNTLAMTTAFFAPHVRDARGFGVLFPRGCGVEALGVRFDSDIFPAGRNGNWRIETWIRRIESARRDLIDTNELWRDASADRQVLTGRADDPIDVVTTYRLHALPLYGGGVLDIQDGLAELPPWLALAGNYTGRLGASKLLDVAAEAAGRIARFDQDQKRRTASARPL